MILFAIMALGVPAYFVSNFDATRFLIMLAVWSTGIYVWECLAQLLSVAFDNPLLGMMQFTVITLKRTVHPLLLHNVHSKIDSRLMFIFLCNRLQGCWFWSFLSSGFLIPPDDLVWPLKIFHYTLPFKYTLHSVIYNEFIDSTYPVCETPSDAQECLCCTSNTLCHGTDGTSVLDSIGSVYSLINSKDTIAQDVGCMLLIALAFKIGYAAILIRKSRRVSK